MSGHKYTVELRIFGADIEPDSITEKLKLRPCRIVYAGTKRADGRLNIPSWAYNGTEGDTKDWESFEEGIQFVLDKVWPHREAIAAYKADGKVLWWCGHFQSGFDGGPSLSAELLKRLGEFNAELFIDNYFHET